MKPLPSTQIVKLLFEIDDLLIQLLESLSEEDWGRPTLAGQWKVKDVAAHLLDGNLRALSMLRDHYYGEDAGDITGYQELVKYLNRLNSDWIKAMRRLSTKVVIEWLKTSGRAYCEYMKTLNPEENATFSVAWAGEQASKNWFHLAREYTEKWHHQQQIRLAVGGADKLLEEEYYYPYLDTSLRGLPYHYRDTEGATGDLIKFVFRGSSDKIWWLRYSQKWSLFKQSDELPNCEVIIPDEDAWKLFTKGIRREVAVRKSTIIGKREIGLKIFDMVAVMA